MTHNFPFFKFYYVYSKSFPTSLLPMEHQMLISTPIKLVKVIIYRYMYNSIFFKKNYPRQSMNLMKMKKKISAWSFQLQTYKMAYTCDAALSAHFLQSFVLKGAEY
jgi:hypothetical protein